MKEVERLQVSFELGIDKFADEVIEEATEAFKKGNQNWSALIIDAFSRKNPELTIFQRIFKKYPSGAPTPWGSSPLAEFPADPVFNQRLRKARKALGGKS